MRVLSVLCLFFVTSSVAPSALAQAYKCKAGDGSVIYSDKPCDGDSRPLILHDNHLGSPPPGKKHSPPPRESSNSLHKNTCNQIVSMYEDSERKIQSGSWSEYFDGVNTKKRLLSAYIKCKAEAKSGN
ncbi:DUF4124 domain-containing protein [Chromobacterium sp. Beijing]|uniref:DUF4124 domain-containing protein n=1 Tax=Chromobacterium sp. Beijing TaxID=2735795 RepID=UPI00351D6BF7|nr:DUF4124 domain-containing protein [Chromobacterium sp. Beijing]